MTSDRKVPPAEEPRRRRVESAPTIYDVARECGVAPSTVSRAFSRPGRVSAETAERIRATAARLGYRTNPMARALPTGRTGMIALVVSDVTNPVYFEVILGAENAAAKAGYTILLADTQESGRREHEALNRAIPTVDGIVLSSSRMSDLAIRMAAKQRPMVVLNRAIADVPSVVTDNERGMRRVLEHLRELGHEAITYVAGPEASWANGMRWRAMREAARELGLKAHRHGPYPPTFAGGVSAVEHLRRQAATAVVAYNDVMAIGLMRGLERGGVLVPRDMSVVGFDDIFGADLCTPALTTVAAPLRTLGMAAVQQLVAQLNGTPPRMGRPSVLPVQLVVRDSTARRYRERPSRTRRTG